MIDASIALGSAGGAGLNQLTDAALEHHLGIRLDHASTDPAVLLGALYVRKVMPHKWLAADAGHLTRYKPRPNGATYPGFSLFLRLDPSRFCLNPYDLAIYIGEPMRFIPMPVSDRFDNQLPGPFVYEWGMFKGSESQWTGGRHFHSMHPKNMTLELGGSEECITSLRLFKSRLIGIADEAAPVAL